MNCLVCGHKLAIFRKLSLGDFCCQEHRSLFLKEQSDRGLARLMETGSELRNRDAGTRVYAQFLHEEVPASPNGTDCRGYGPLTQAQVIGPETVRKQFSRLAPARMLECADPEIGVTAPIYFEAAGISLRLPGSCLPVWKNGAASRLRQAGLILPWSSGARSQAVFSLAPLAAAAWAQSGYSKPIHTHQYPIGSRQFAWPRIEGKLELPALVRGMAPAAFAALESPVSQPMRVRLATPLTPANKPRLELALPVPTRIEDCPTTLPETESAPAAEPIPAPTTPALTLGAAPKKGWLSQLTGLFWVTPTPERVLSARARARLRHREETYTYDDPLAPVRPTSGQAWRAMFAGWMPSPSIASALFAVLFLFSTAAIFLSAPAALSRQSTSFRLTNLRNAIRGRAALRFEDDFRAGLSKWIGPSGWSRDWSYDPAGFLHPGTVGFLQQSMNLVNYRMEFMGQIERKSLGWAFRAKDESNYYVAKLTITRPGPLPLVDLVHYPVTNGKEGPRISVALPFTVRNDTLYEVEMNIRGDQFRASVNGHVVDAWTDNNLRAGGVGLLSGAGEAARVRWIRVSDHDDVIGRVCSYLSARYYQPADEPILSASYYTILRSPGLTLISR
jgi:hypothetical protein